LATLPIGYVNMGFDMDYYIATYDLKITDPSKVNKIVEPMVQYLNYSALHAFEANDIRGLNEIVRDNYTINTLGEDRYLISIHIPQHPLFEQMGFPSLFGMLFGNVVRDRRIKSIRLLGIEFPEQYYRKYQGPYLGIEGLAKKFSKSLPLIAVATGLLCDTDGRFSASTNQLIKEDVDIIIDNPFEIHVRNDKTNSHLHRIMELLEGSSTIYVVNITGDLNSSIDLANHVRQVASEHQVTYGLRLCPFSAGFAVLPNLRTSNSDGFIYAYSMFNRIISGTPFYGIAPGATASILRLLGADFVTIGSPFDESAERLEDLLAARGTLLMRGESFRHIRRSIPVLSGGIMPWNVGYLLDKFGDEIVLHVGKGIWYSPLNNTGEALAAYRQAIKNFHSGVSLRRAMEGGGRSPLSKYLKQVKWESISKFDVIDVD